MTKLVRMLRFQVGISFEDLYMRAAISLLFLFFTNGVVGEEISVPKTFVDGEVAEAADFNSNFDYLEDALNNRAPWLTADSSGASTVQVDCSSNPMALVDAYQSNMTVRHLNLAAKGDCYGAIDLYAYTDDDDSPAVTTLQTKGQAFSIFPQEGAVLKIIPRPILVGEDTYWLSRLYASFGNMLGVSDLTLQMGVDDGYALLFSRASNGDVSNVEITGASETENDQLGIRIQNGANTYVGNTSITNVVDGIQLQNASSLYLYGETIIEASNRGIWAFIDASIRTNLSGSARITSPSALSLTLGGTGWFYGSGLIDGDIGLGESNLVIQGDMTVSSATNVTLNNSAFHAWFTDAQTSGLTLDMFSCSGPSTVEVDGLDFRNQDNSGCLDAGGWSNLINTLDTESSKPSPDNLSKPIRVPPTQLNPVPQSFPDFLFSDTTQIP